jgi:hypothetical protein
MELTGSISFTGRAFRCKSSPLMELSRGSGLFTSIAHARTGSIQFGKTLRHPDSYRDQGPMPRATKNLVKMTQKDRIVLLRFREASAEQRAEEVLRPEFTFL